MTVALSKSIDEIRQMPLVELAWEIFKAKKEPIYFRDLMKQIQELRGMSDDEVNEVIARLYTEINIDGRFVCIGQNVWGLNRWYPVDNKVAERSLAGKKFVRRSSGDAFSDDDEDEDEDFEDLHDEEDNDEVDPLFGNTNDAEDTDDDLAEDDAEDEEEDVDAEFEEEPLLEEDDEDEEDED